jgi:GntR family transcriptional regulator, transcriptional repressor for pyruvate dehydrogenase complex
MKAREYLNKAPNNITVEHIIESLQNYIIEGGLKPGEPIMPEREMAESLGVSRFSLREALRVAQSQGLIEIKRGCRPKIAKPSSKAASHIIALNLRRSKNARKNLIEARKDIECIIARYAAKRSTSKHIENLKKCISMFEKNRNNMEACIEKDIEFHNILLNACDNEIFAIMLEPLSELLRESRKICQTIEKIDAERAIVGHKKILDAVIKKDSEQAAKAMLEHLEMAEEDLNQVIET